MLDHEPSDAYKRSVAVVFDVTGLPDVNDRRAWDGRAEEDISR
jgi:hypothetical protein